MKWIYRVIFVALLIFLTTFPLVRADELDDITHQLEDTKKILNDIHAATQTNEQQLSNLRQQIAAIKAKVTNIEVEIQKKEKEVQTGEQALEHQHNLLNQRAYSYYKNVGKNQSSLITLLIANDFSTSVQNFFYQKSLIDEDRRMIIKIVAYIKDLEEKKKTLQSEKDRLASVKDTVDKQSTFLAGEVEKSKKYEVELQQKIASLTSRQQEILAQKLASLNIPKSAGTTMGGCTDDRNVDPGFSPRFAFFTFGVPNRVGLNQWGAKGRAEANQNAEQILKAYYNADYTTGYNQGINIHVTGSNEYGQSFDDNWNIEEYLTHLYEMPTAWPAEALKAQAIAARSYALAVTNDGQSTICPSQSCQVVKKEQNNDVWKNAVHDTAGIVMTNGGKPIKAWFSSTHGGYVFRTGEIGWGDTAWTKHAQDTSSNVSNFSDLLNNAYDKNSPWFYCDWGARASYGKTAWLKADELADITNSLMLAKRDANIQNHLAQPDKPNPDGVETWDASRVKSELKNRGGNPFNLVSDVNIGWDSGGGRVNTVTISGDGGSQSFDGGEFKNFFNLRAPANIQIVGPLFNIEKE
jgi:SpoIID/LytB domain protein